MGCGPSVPLVIRPRLGDALLALGTWMAEYYLAPPGEVFRALLPPESARLGREDDVARRTVWVAALTQAGRAALDSGGLDPTAARVLALLAVATEPVPLAAIRGDLALARPPFRALARRGWIRLEKQLVRSSPWARNWPRRG